MSSVTPQWYDDPDRSPLLVISVHQDDVTALQYLPDGRRVVAGFDDGAVKIWNVENGQQEGVTMGHQTEVRQVATTRDGTKIISNDCHGYIKVWDVKSHELVQEWIHPERETVLSLSPDDQLIAVGDIKNLSIYNSQGQQVNHPIDVGTRVWSLSFSPDGNKLACGTYYDIRVYDVKNGTLLLGPLKSHEWYCAARVLWSRDGSRIFLASADSTIRCWNSTTGRQIGRPWSGHTDLVLSISLSPDGSILASVSHDDTIRFWDTASGNPLPQYLHLESSVYEICFSPCGKFFVSATWDGKICLWDVPWLNSAESLTNHPRNPAGYSHDFQLHHQWAPTVQDRNTSRNTCVALQCALPDLSFGANEPQGMFEPHSGELLDPTTSTGLDVPHSPIPSTLHPEVWKTSWAASEVTAGASPDTTQASRVEPSTSIFRSMSSVNHKKMHKVVEIKEKLVGMLREVGLTLPSGRLPWFALEGNLQKKGYMVVNWPDGVVRDRERGVSGLSAEDANKLYNALFVDEQRLQFVWCGVGEDFEGGHGAGSDAAQESDRSCIRTGAKQRRFVITTAEAYTGRPPKRSRHV